MRAAVPSGDSWVAVACEGYLSGQTRISEAIKTPIQLGQVVTHVAIWRLRHNFWPYPRLHLAIRRDTLALEQEFRV